MPTAPRKSSRTKRLAAPLVMTAMMGAGCSEPIHTNPVPPREPEPTATVAVPETAAVATSEPTAAPTQVATTSATAVADLPAPPTGEDGHVERLPDGTCLYVFANKVPDCPPHTLCNPGPPRKPLKVKCPASGPGF